jgi:hypothetical protein
MVCLASTGNEFDAENSLRVEYLWYPVEYHVRCKLFIFFKNINYIQFIEILFLGWWSMLQLSTKKISLKSDTERGKYARFSRLVPFFVC